MVEGEKTLAMKLAKEHGWPYTEVGKEKRSHATEMFRCGFCVQVGKV